MLRDFIVGPLTGTTSLWRLTWLYGIVVGTALDLVGALLAGSSVPAQRAVLLLGLAYALYLTLATYRCAANSRWPRTAPLVRMCAVLSLPLLALLGYLALTTDVAGVIDSAWRLP